MGGSAYIYRRILTAAVLLRDADYMLRYAAGFFFEKGYPN